MNFDSASRGLSVARWDRSAGVPTGTAVPALSKVFMQPGDGQPFVDVAANGTLIFAPADLDERALAWIDRDGEVERIEGTEGLVQMPDLSPDGTRVVYRGDGDQLWIVNLTAGTRTRLVGDGSGASFWPKWAHDGESVVFASNADGSWNLYRVDASGRGTPEVLLQREGMQVPQSIAPSGDLLFLDRAPNQGNDDLWLLSRTGEPSPFLATSFREHEAHFSPDGRFVAYASNETGASEVYVVSASGEGEKVTVSVDGSRHPAWSHSGRELFFRRRNDMMVVRVETEGGFRAAQPKRLFDATAVSSYFDNFDVSVNDERLLVVHRSPESIANRLRIVLNWDQELERLVPTD